MFCRLVQGKTFAVGGRKKFLRPKQTAGPRCCRRSTGVHGHSMNGGVNLALRALRYGNGNVYEPRGSAAGG